MSRADGRVPGHDVVVVGAGSAGCALAARLTEDRATRVLLLEAGERADTRLVRIPIAFPQLFKTRWDWGYETVEQQQLGGRRAYWPRMKGLGGCSAMNAMIYVRGNGVDYDGWRDGHGAVGWGYADVLPYFLRAEGNSRGASPYHGADGPLRVEDRRYTHELTRAWVDAAVAAGMPRNPDVNGPQQDGVGLYQVTQRAGRRWSAADAYLRPALRRPNLDVVTGAAVSRVLLARGRAVGVAYTRAGVEHVAWAGSEVVLAAGTIGSAQLLLLSGIGPAGHLREVGVQVVAHLPGVGENLHDHPATPLVWHTRGAMIVWLPSMLRLPEPSSAPTPSRVESAAPASSLPQWLSTSSSNPAKPRVSVAERRSSTMDEPSGMTSRFQTSSTRLWP